ncbi:LLM class flavin-dependent oxidoreductase [Nocardia sp. NPDC088792]|uniref:LLM class flavin-dependent oxidoreductase n=1 Tax=Nocardia sp. NPDC088792 TaxID=3364332 RepID=UPI00381BD362
MAIEHEYRTRLFAVGIELDGEGWHPAAWRRAGHEPARLLESRTLRERVAAAENAGFTFATFDDSLAPPAHGPGGRLDATTRAAFVAATTSTLGLVPVVAATYAEPFHVSSQLATLDYASRGRAGWLVTDEPRAARAWGREPRVLEPEIRRERTDSVEVARRLWDSWEDDAVVRDYATGRFLNRDKLHYADFIGETFSVKGPAIVPRPPQGQVVVFGDATTGSDRLDVAVVTAPTVPAALDAARRARAAGVPRVVIDLRVTLDTPAATAAERLAALRTGTDNHPSGNRPETTAARAEADVPSSGAVANAGNGNTSSGGGPATGARGTVNGVSPDAPGEPESGVRLNFSGSAAELVAVLTELATEADGVRLHPAVLDEDLPVLARYVLPALLRSGLAHRPVPGSTLRANLGLSRPANRYVKEATR